MTLKSRLPVLLLSTPVLAFVVVGGLMGNASARSGDDTFQHLRVFDDVLQHVISTYVEEVKVDKVMEGAMKGLADGLDPDSAYLNAKLLAEVESGSATPEGDVGLELTRQFYLRVIAARDGSPAAKAGLHTGDYVRAIDGKPARDMSVFEGTRLLRGQPGSKVTLTVIRGNAADPHEVSLVREKAAGPVVTGRLISLAGRDVPAAKAGDMVDLPLLSAEAGYVRIASFRSGVVEDRWGSWREELWSVDGRAERHVLRRLVRRAWSPRRCPPRCREATGRARRRLGSRPGRSPCVAGRR